MIEDGQQLEVEERIVLSKFDGEPLPENEFERIHILNGQIVAIQGIENGEVVWTNTVEEVD